MKSEDGSLVVVTTELAAEHPSPQVRLAVSQGGQWFGHGFDALLTPAEARAVARELVAATRAVDGGRRSKRKARHDE